MLRMGQMPETKKYTPCMRATRYSIDKSSWATDEKDERDRYYDFLRQNLATSASMNNPPARYQVDKERL
jgi:hypothetical protein